MCIRDSDKSTRSRTKSQILGTNKERLPLSGKKNIKRNAERFIIRKGHSNTANGFDRSQGRFHKPSDAFPDNYIQTAVFGYST